MKKIIAVLCFAVLLTFVFAGCGDKKDKTSSASDTETTVSGSTEMTDASGGAETVSGSDESGSDNNGAVTDGDGIIGNEDEEDATEDKTDDAIDDLIEDEKEMMTDASEALV